MFNPNVNYTKVNFGLPEGVSAIVRFVEKTSTSYGEFLAEIMARHIPASIIISTNNRKLSFFTHSWHKPGKAPIEPTLTKNGKYRPRKKDGQYLMKWNAKKWNIADTQERFILDSGVECQLLLRPYQEFNLILKLGYDQV